MTHTSPFPGPQTLHAPFRVGRLGYEVEIAIPDLRGNPFRCWGDWGPMYTVQMSREQCFVAAYSDPSRRIQATYTVKPKTVCLHSPVLARERERFPLYLEFDDEPRGLRFRVFLNAAGQACTPRVQAALGFSHVDELIFPLGAERRASA